MNRRGFMKLFAAIGTALTVPINVKAEQSVPTDVRELQPEHYVCSISDFGADDTVVPPSLSDGVTKSYVDALTTGLCFVNSADWFPKHAYAGTLFHFQPPQEHEYLKGAYAFNGTQWLKIASQKL